MRPIFHIFSETKKLFFDFASFTANLTMRAMRFSKRRFGVNLCRLKLGQYPFTALSPVYGSIQASFAFRAFSRFTLFNFDGSMELVQKMVFVVARHLTPQIERICDSPTTYALKPMWGKLYVSVESLCIFSRHSISRSFTGFCQYIGGIVSVLLRERPRGETSCLQFVPSLIPVEILGNEKPPFGKVTNDLL